MAAEAAPRVAAEAASSGAISMSLDHLDRLAQALEKRLVVRLGADEAPTSDEVRKALYESIIDVFGYRGVGADEHANRPSLGRRSGSNVQTYGRNLSLDVQPTTPPDLGGIHTRL